MLEGIKFVLMVVIIFAFLFGLSRVGRNKIIVIGMLFTLYWGFITFGAYHGSIIGRPSKLTKVVWSIAGWPSAKGR